MHAVLKAKYPLGNAKNVDAIKFGCLTHEYNCVCISWLYILGWSGIRVKFQKLIYSSLLHTVRLIKKVTTFSLVLHSLNSTNQIVIHEHFKELQKMNNLPPVPSNLINLFGFYVKMKTNVSKPKWENNRFSFIVYRGQILLKLL